MAAKRSRNVNAALEFLKVHHEAFFKARPYADRTGHPVPSDTRACSQILVSLLTGIPGLKRRKGPDLADRSDVKAANVWEAIDTPRFNNVIKAGTKSDVAGRLESLDEMPYLFFVMWDTEPTRQRHRCRIWVTRPADDQVFREVCRLWYRRREEGVITSDNFQLHPPRGLDSDVFRNTCGNLEYPLLFRADWMGDRYEVVEYRPEMMRSGKCRYA